METRKGGKFCFTRENTDLKMSTVRQEHQHMGKIIVEFLHV